MEEQPAGVFLDELVTGGELLIGGRAPKVLKKFAETLVHSYESASRDGLKINRVATIQGDQLPQVWEDLTQRSREQAIIERHVLA